MIKVITLLCGLFWACNNYIEPLIVGSDAVVSREDRASFKADETDNEMLGHALFEDGFRLQDKTTTVTYNNFYQVLSQLNLRGGTVFLQEDLVLYNESGFSNGGCIDGLGKHSVEFSTENDNAELVLPGEFTESDCGLLSKLSTIVLDEAIFAVDWSIGDKYLAVGIEDTGDVDPELLLYSVQDNMLTLTNSVNLGEDCNCVRWHPTLNYLAVCRNDVSGDEVQIYFRNISNGTLTVTDGEEIGDDATACAWHPSGNYLLVGTEVNANELILYSFSGGSITQIQTLNQQDRTINRHAISWSPGGDYVAVGYANGPDDELKVYHFDGTLTLTVSDDVGKGVRSLDWSPTGTVIAIGLDGSTSRIRLYEHRVWNGDLTEIISGQVMNSATIQQEHWNNTGDCLAVSTSAGNNSALQLYDYDRNQQTFDLFDEDDADSELLAVRWSRDNSKLVRGTRSDMELAFYAVGDTSVEPLIFKNTYVVINTDTRINLPVFFEGNCKLNAQGNKITIGNEGAFIFKPGSTVTIQDTVLANIDDVKLYCMTDDCDLTFMNCELCFGREYTFSLGSILFQSDVVMTGSLSFTYGASQASTIDSFSCLTMDKGFTFTYAPLVANKELIEMTDKTSKLVLDNATLRSTSTGMKLSKGTLLIDNHVTLSSEGLFAAEGIDFASDLDVKILSNATIDVFGHLNTQV